MAGSNINDHGNNYKIEFDKLLDYDCVEEIVLLFVQIVVYIFYGRVSKGPMHMAGSNFNDDVYF
jgi:hypothetical protein